MNRDLRTVGNHLYVAVLLPFNRQMKVDEAAYRNFLQHFLKNERFVRMGGGLCINPEAGEIFISPARKAARLGDRHGGSAREGADPCRHLGHYHGRDARF